MNKFIPLLFFITLSFITASSYFIVVNSNRVEFYEVGEPQDMSSGLYSSYINDGNNDYNKIKAKGGLLVDFDLDGDLDLTYGFSTAYYFKNDNGIYEDITDSLDEVDDDDDDDEENEDQQVASVEEVTVEKLDDEFDYNKLKVSELKQLAKTKGLEGYKSLKKGGLVDLLKSSE